MNLYLNHHKFVLALNSYPINHLLYFVQNQKDKIKKHYEDNKDKIKKYNEDNKDKIKERKTKLFDCECGKTQLQLGNKSQHIKTKFHLNHI